MLWGIGFVWMIKWRDNALGQTPSVGVFDPDGVMAYKWGVWVNNKFRLRGFVLTSYQVIPMVIHFSRISNISFIRLKYLSHRLEDVLWNRRECPELELAIKCRSNSRWFPIENCGRSPPSCKDWNHNVQEKIPMSMIFRHWKRCIFSIIVVDLSVLRIRISELQRPHFVSSGKKSEEKEKKKKKELFNWVQEPENHSSYSNMSMLRFPINKTPNYLLSPHLVLRSVCSPVSLIKPRRSKGT